jgi:hypothetical protein
MISTPEGVHQPQTLVMKIEQPVSKLGPHVRSEWLRIAKCGFDREVILERDLSLHAFSRTYGDA